MPQQPHDPSQPYPVNHPYPSGQPYPYGQPPISGVPAAPGPVSGPAPGLPGGRSRPSRLGPGQRAALYVGGGTLAVLLLCGLGVTAVAALVPPDTSAPGTAVNAGRTGRPTTAAASNADAGAAAPDGTPTPVATPPPSAATPTPAASPSSAPIPTVEKKTVTETRSVAFPKRTVKDPSLAKGKTKVRTRGVAGVKTLTYEVTLTNGLETARRLVSQQVTRQPVAEVVAVGTKETRRCDPNYSGCVPIASDVDCAGGSGDGPAYVTGPVRVIGKDIYRLDHDKDGYGCE